MVVILCFKVLIDKDLSANNRNPNFTPKNSTVTRKTTNIKRKCRHFANIFITGCTRSWCFENIHCRQWGTVRQNDVISVLVIRVEIMHDLTSHRTERITNTPFQVVLHSTKAFDKVDFMEHSRPNNSARHDTVAENNTGPS